MGTRHLIAVQLGGEYKVAQYGQWDGYPSCTGVDVLDFLRGVDISAFEDKASKCKFATEDQLAQLNEIDWKNYYPQFSRDVGSDVLKLIMKEPDGILLVNSIDFAKDSLFCEWAYVIDLDTGLLEVFKGFNTQPVAEDARFNGAPDGEYCPVRLKCVFDIKNLPPKDDFLAALKKEDEEVA